MGPGPRRLDAVHSYDLTLASSILLSSRTVRQGVRTWWVPHDLIISWALVLPSPDQDSWHVAGSRVKRLLALGGAQAAQLSVGPGRGSGYAPPALPPRFSWPQESGCSG